MCNRFQGPYLLYRSIGSDARGGRRRKPGDRVGEVDLEALPRWSAGPASGQWWQAQHPIRPCAARDYRRQLDGQKCQLRQAVLASNTSVSITCVIFGSLSRYCLATASPGDHRRILIAATAVAPSSGYSRCTSSTVVHEVRSGSRATKTGYGHLAIGCAWL